MKNQIKKSLSLFMAVLMVLSCWVWVAPQKAEAANQNDGYYYIEVYGDYKDYTNDASAYSKWTVNYKEANGTGADKSMSMSAISVQSTSLFNGGIIASAWVPGFPTSINGAHHIAVTGSGTNKSGDGFRYENLNVRLLNPKTNTYITLDGGNYSFETNADNGDLNYTYSWDFDTHKPNIDSFTLSALSPDELTIPEMSSSATVKATTTATIKDQYGTKWVTAPEYIVGKTEGALEDIGGEDNGIYITTSGMSATVNINKDLQTTQVTADENGEETFYVVASVKDGDGVAVVKSVSLKVNYPKYTIKVNGAGSITGLNYTLGLTGGGTTTKDWEKSAYYGASIDPMPDGTGSAAGYTFKGIWSKEQPATGNASYNEKEADFATPISSTKFDEYKANGGTVNGDFITYGEEGAEKLYYNAGTEWSTANKTITASAEYYGWWLSKDINVKFYDIDGKFLGAKAVKYGQTQGDIEWPTPTEDTYVSGSFQYSNFNGTWVDINGDTVSQSAHTFTKDLILTPKYDTVSFDKTYIVNFKDEIKGENLDGSAEYAYRTDLSSPNVIPADRTVPSDIENDRQYSYTFEGWSTQKPINNSNYHVLLEDGDFDTEGNAIGINSDWIVRSDMTFYPVYRRHLRTYAVNFWFKDSTGTEISRKVTLKYGETLSAPIEYVPYNYAQEGYGYEFENWTYTAASGEVATFDYDKSIVFTKENISLNLGAVEDGDNVTPVVIRAAYGAPVATPYTVTFNYKNDKGEDQTYTAEVKHGELILGEDVGKLLPADEYDDGKALVHFTDSWELVEGAGKMDETDVSAGTEENPVNPEIATDDLTSFSPTSHVTFEAVYGNPEPFYTVTYIDGANTFSERVLVGSNLPVWTTKVTNDNETPDNPDDDFEEDLEYLPTMADSAQGSYEFLGWFDEKQTDADYAVTNGTEYDATSTVAGDLTLYPQFKFNPYTYTIKFMSYDGKTQLAAGQYEYGQSIEMLTTEANKSAQSREQDDTYTYSFIGWDKTVPAFCEGQDMTFIALYKPVYRYYEAKWYNSVLDGKNWVADKSTKTEGEGEDEKTIETGLLATTKHTYNSKLYTPSIDNLACTATPPAGQSYVFAGWYYNDADGNAHPYERGMLITAEMEFYATYTLTAKTYTVTTDVKGTKAEYKVAEGAKAEAIPEPNAGYVEPVYEEAENGEYYVNEDGEYVKVEDGPEGTVGTHNMTKESCHDAFVGWYTTLCICTDTDDDGVINCECVKFDIATATITADITIYAKFAESEHEYDNEELVTAPTYYAKGEMKKWCSCDAKQTETKAEIAMLTDTVKPTGTIYLGTQGSWSSTDEVGAAATDNDDVTLYANENTDLILTINDTGDVNALYNPSGIGKGIGVIQGFISKGVYSQDNQNVEMSEVIKIFEDATENLNNTANYVVKLGQYGNLEEGATYVAYYYVRDKADNVLNAKVRTAKFIYDNTEPVFTVEGDNNADKVAGTPTYCETATVTGIENGATLTVNGVAVANDAITWDTVDEVTTGTYEITEAGNYLVTVTDKAGNKTSKKFTVNDDHSYDVKEVLSTCTEDGYKTEICIVCGDEKDKVVYKTTGHVVTSAVYEATCLENGYILSECSQCDYSVKTEFEVDEDGEFVLGEDGEKIPVFPALGHDYDKDNGEIVYTVVTAATCKTKGKEIATCKACGETISREIAIDADAHNWGAVKTLKATCTANGKTYQTCKLCYKSNDLSVIPATGHVETQWVETAAATCGTAGVETLQCKKCKAYVDSDDEGTEIDTREIPATGRHILAVSEDPTKTYEATADKEGQITRYCTQCGQEWTEKVDKIEKFTVKFVDEDGTTEIKTIADVVKGETVTANDLVDDEGKVITPTKANSEDGKYKYTFAGWKDAKGNAVTLPIDVTSDITLKASYTQSTIIYTHQFMVPNTWVAPLSEDGYDEFAIMMGAMGDSRVPVATPEFSLADKEDDEELKKLYTFKFLGWSTTGAKGDIVTDFTITGDTTFYAVFEAEAVSYQVIYYNGTEYVWDTYVDGGETVEYGKKDAEGKLVYPIKDADDTNHYAFDKWYTDATLKTEFDADTAITATTRLYAGFTATEHSCVVDTSVGEVVDEAAPEVKNGIVQKATCTLPELTQMICSCGYTKTEQTAPALGHKESDPVTEKDGDVYYSVVYCSVCKAEISRTKTTVTVAFKNWNGVRLDTQNLNMGAAIEYKGAAPAKAADEQNTYTFAGWFIEGDATQTVVTSLGTATADVVFVAKFTPTVRTFRVTYIGVNNETLQTKDGIKYGEKVPEFTGTNPAKDYDDTYHYTFKEWSVAAGAEVTTDIVIKPVFNEIKHEYNEGVASDPTCTTPGGYLYTCDCGHYYTNGTIAKLPHKFEETDRKEPDYANGKDGYIKYECAMCGEPKEESLSSKLIEVKVEVKDTNGVARSGVEVKLYVKGTGTLVGTQKTDNSGIATFSVAPGTYTAKAEGRETNITVDKNGKPTVGKVEVEPAVTAPGCSCTCHKTTFWGILFRLLHKFIKLFTGKYVCCADPSNY